MGSTALAVLPDEALAACVNIGGSEWECSGANAVSQNIFEDNANVVTIPGFSVDTPNAEALRIEGDGAISYFDDEASNLTSSVIALHVRATGDAGVTQGSVTIMTGGDITGGNVGILAYNSGSGATSVTATGHVEGTGREGIHAFNAATATDLTIIAASASGGEYGIYANNLGTGTTHVTATGHVEGGDIGIEVEGGAQTGHLEINAASVMGGQHGINVENHGTGATSVTATGHAEGGAGAGINVLNAETATDLTIEAASASGGDFGIQAINGGTGLTSVTVFDRAEGGIAGVHAENTANALEDLTVIVHGEAVGGDFGIHTVNEGQGSSSVWLTDDGLAEGVIGVYAENGVAAFGVGARVDGRAVGEEYGVAVVNEGTGETWVTGSGSVEGGFGGIEVVAGAATAGNVYVDFRDGSVAGGTYGIHVDNMGLGETVVYTPNTFVEGGEIGIFVENGATATGLSIEAAGGVSGGEYGIRAVNDGTGATTVYAYQGAIVGGTETGIAVGGGANTTSMTIGVSADVSGGINGIGALYEGAGGLNVQSRGHVEGGQSGIYAEAYGDALTVEVNSAVGGEFGVQALNFGTGATTITATGNVQGGLAGIYAENGANATDIVIELAELSADPEGGTFTAIAADNQGTGATRITATGHVQGLIFADNGATATDLTVEVETMQGAVVATNEGTGATLVRANGHVVGGFLAVNQGMADGLTVEVASVGGVVLVRNAGIGATLVRASGHIEGGVLAENQGMATDLTVELETLQGSASAMNDGTGATLVTANGHVDGGIQAFNGDDATDLTIELASVTANLDSDLGETAVFAQNDGTGATRVTASGPVVGHVAAISNVNATGLVVEAQSVTGNVVLVNAGGGATRLATSGAVEGGLIAFGGADTQGLTIETAGVSLGEGAVFGGAGIAAVHAGQGANRVAATGPVEGSDYGILAVNTDIDVTQGLLGDVPVPGPGGTDLTVEATSATGGRYGIAAFNGGAGATRVTATGHVEGGEIGIYAMNAAVDPFALVFGGGEIDVTGPGGTSLTVEAASVSGGAYGIAAENDGTGATRITATGHVEGALYAIGAFNGGDATDLFIDAVSTTGLILAQNSGTGATRITATGHVEGGVLALNGETATHATVEVDSVTGSVFALNQGTGATRVTAGGMVEGAITAVNGADTDSLTVEAAGVGGGEGGFLGNAGIMALHAGAGASRVAATGPVEGSTYGILAVNSEIDLVATLNNDLVPVLGPGGTDLTVEAASVSGGFYGIAAFNGGAGATRVTATGHVEGGEIGIYAMNAAVDPIALALENEVVVLGPGGTSLTVEAASASGGAYGIYAENTGAGPTSVTVTGLVEGGEAGIFASADGQPVAVLNDGGLVRNLSGLSADRAIVAEGGPVTLESSGGIVGTVAFGDGADSFLNSGTWTPAGGTSDFGAGADQFTNTAAGVLVAAVNGAVAETTRLDGLETFSNAGLVTLMDGGAGDVLRIEGDAGFQAGSTLAVDLGADGTADLFLADGTVALDGATLAVDVSGGLLYGHSYMVVTAEGGLAGTFGSIDGNVRTAFLTLEDRYDANNAYLDVVQYRDLVEAAMTRNQIATAGGLDSLPGGVLFGAVVSLPTDEVARIAFDALSGEVHASAAGTLVEDSRTLRDVATSRIRAAFGAAAPAPAPLLAYGPGGSDIASPAAERFNVWGHVSGRWGERDGDGNAADLDTDARHFIAGADGLLGDYWRVGLLAGYSRTGFEAPARASAGDADSWHLGLYGGTEWNNLAFRAGFIHSWHDVSTSRVAAFPGFAETLSADYDARTAQLFGELAYGFDTGSARFEPFAGLAYVRHSTGSYTETGGVAALSSAGSVTETTFLTLGLRAETDLPMGTVEAKLRGMLGWQHAFGDVAATATHAFVGGSPFTVAGAPIARNAALVEIGLDMKLTPTATLGISYGGQFASSVSDHAVRADLGVRF